MDDSAAPLSDEERRELEQLRAEKAERERQEKIRAERAELERLRAESKEAEANSEKRLNVLNALSNTSELSGHKVEQHKWLQ
jgi:hypothetical protein